MKSRRRVLFSCVLALAATRHQVIDYGFTAGGGK